MFICSTVSPIKVQYVKMIKQIMAESRGLRAALSNSKLLHRLTVRNMSIRHRSPVTKSGMMVMGTEVKSPPGNKVLESHKEKLSIHTSATSYLF